MATIYRRISLLFFWTFLLFGVGSAATGKLKVIGTSFLGTDPQTVNRLNGESFQQDALITFNGFQYAAFYDARTSTNASVRYVSVARRELSSSENAGSTGEWETLTLRDYAQTDDDGHNVISLGISSGTGAIHLGFDQHDNDLNYRVSKAGVATDPHNVSWNSELFGPVVNVLPGLENLDVPTHFQNVTYPRFLSIPSPEGGSASSGDAGSDLLLEMRVGRAGLGDDWLYAYAADGGGQSGKWTLIGKYLEGVNNNAYINGLDFDLSRTLHTTWTYRDYINDTGQDVAVEAGPNGPENNHDLMYASSADLGNTWINSWGQIVSVVNEGNESTNPLQGPIYPDSPGVTVFSIPKYGGILNQEAQTLDSAGRIHVLNRENTTGIERWYHYWRTPAPQGFWVRNAFPLNIREDPNNVTGTPTVIGKRGKLLSVSSNSKVSNNTKGEEETTYLLAILPSNAPNSTALTILAATSRTSTPSSSGSSGSTSLSYLSQFTDWSVVWSVGNGNSPGTSAAEPLFDRYRLAQEAVLSLFLVGGDPGDGAGQDSGGNITVVDFDVSSLFE